MNDKEILKRAIKKAHKNGWNEAVDFNRLDWSITYDVNFIEYQYYYAIIFSHKFAEALWGESEIETNLIIRNYTNPISNELEDIENQKLPLWKYHIQQMVLEENPIQYLVKFL